MPPKKQQQTNIDESKVLIEALKLSGKNADKVAKLIELFPSLTKSAALNAVVKANKQHRESKIKDTSKDVENVIQSLQTKLYIDATKESQEIYEVVKVIIKPIVIDNKKYFYDSNKNKLYDSELIYVGRYKAGKIYTEYPDSDAEPIF